MNHSFISNRGIEERLNIIPILSLFSDENGRPSDRKGWYQFKGKDGKDYATPELLREANLEYHQRFFPFFVHDAVEGRMEIPEGTGEVQICVGLKKEYQNGLRVDVPVYQTKTV